MDGNMCKEERKSQVFFFFLPPQREPGTGNSGPWTLAQRAGCRREALQGLERGQVIHMRAGCQRQQQKLQT